MKNDGPMDVILDFNNFYQSESDFIHSHIHNRFGKKFNFFVSRSDDEILQPKDIDYLPVIIKLKESNNFFKYLDTNDKKRIQISYVNKMSIPIKVKKRFKVAVGGPFGFDNILSPGKNNMFFIDDEGLYAFQDFSYFIIDKYTRLVETETIDDFDSQFSFSFVYRINVKKFRNQNYFMLAFYYLEKILKKGLFKILFTFSNDSSFETFIGKNYLNINESQCFICSNFENSKYYYSKLRNIVNKKSIYFI